MTRHWKLGQRNCVGSGEPKADRHFILGSEPCLLAMFELSLKEERKKGSIKGECVCGGCVGVGGRGGRQTILWAFFVFC